MVKIDFNIVPADPVGDVAVFLFRGSISTVHGQVLHDFFTGLQAAGVIRVVVDLSGITTMVSVGLGEMAYCHNLLRRNGGGLALAAPSPRVRELLKLSRMDTVLTLRDTVVSAAAALAPSSSGS